MRSPQLCLVIGCLLVAASGKVTAQDSPGVQVSAEVRTSGTGDVALSPDRAIVRIGVETEDSAAAIAAQRNKAQFSRVLDTLRALGFPTDSLQRLSYTVQPNYDWERGRRITGYRARAVIRLTLRDLDQLATVIDGVLAAGATDIPFVDFESDTADSARVDALAEALRRAQADAEALSAARGARLGRLLEVSTSRRDWDNYVFAEAAAYSMQSPMDLAPREVHIRVTVYTRWQLQS